MAENEISIVITAVDNVSKQLDVISANIAKMSTASTEQTQKLGNAFQETTGTLLLFGQAVDKAEGISRTYENAQLRLENAQERLSNAQDRYADATSNVNDLVKQGITSGDKYTKALTEQERAGRSLIISQNNLERANNQVIASYIFMGVQTLSLLSDLPKLATSLGTVALKLYAYTTATEAATAAEIDFEAFSGPIGWGILAAGAAAATGAFLFLKYQNKVDSTSDSMNALALSTKKATDNVNVLNKAINISPVAGADISSIISPALTGAMTIQMDQMAQNTLSSAYVLNQSYGETSDSLDKQTKVVQQGIQAQTALNTSSVSLVNTQDDYAAKIRAIVYNDAQHKLSTGMGAASAALGGTSNTTGGTNIGGEGTSHVTFNDFISRPGQGMATFSPNDIIIGVKDASSLKNGGVNVYIENVNGVDSEQIAMALQDRLRNLVIT